MRKGRGQDSVRSHRGTVPRLILVACFIGGSFFPGAFAKIAASHIVADRNYVTPEALDVVDVQTTVKERSLEGEAVPIVIRRRPQAVAEAEAQLREAFDRTRDRFLDALEHEFGERTLEIRTINSARFRAFRSEFQSANPLMPVNLILAQTWAKGYDGAPTVERLAGALREVMEQSLVGELRPASTIFLVNLDETVRIRSWGEAARFATPIQASAILSVDEAGLKLRRGLDALDRVMGGFVSGMIQPTVVEDVYLTSLVLGEQLGGRAVRRRFHPGELIAREGEGIDRWGTLALEQMRRSGIEPLDVDPRAGAVVADSPEIPRDPDSGSPVPWWAIVGFGMVVAAGSFLFFAVRRRPAGGQLVSGSAQARDLKEAVAPHLARELKDKLVHALYSQRSVLLANEESASERVAELEERLARLQPAIAEKIRGYERRIAALEAQLEEKDQQTRDLIRAKLVLARKELEEEIARNRIRWNN